MDFQVIVDLCDVLEELSFWVRKLKDRDLLFQLRELRKFRQCCEEAKDCSNLSEENRYILGELILSEPTLRSLANAAIGARLNQLELRASTFKEDDYQIWLQTRSASETFWHLIENLTLVKEATAGLNPQFPLDFHQTLEENLKRCLAGLTWLQRILDDGKNLEAILLLDRLKPWIEQMRVRLRSPQPLSMSELWELRGSEDELCACGAAPMLSQILALSESYQTCHEQDSQIRKWLKKAELLANFAIYLPSWMLQLEQEFQINS